MIKYSNDHEINDQIFQSTDVILPSNCALLALHTLRFLFCRRWRSCSQKTTAATDISAKIMGREMARASCHLPSEGGGKEGGIRRGAEGFVIKIG